MAQPLVPTIEFSPAKAQLSDVMTRVFHGHQPRLVSRHNGKEQMLLVRPDDLIAMLGDHRFDVRAVYDADAVTLRIPDLGILGFGETLDEAVGDLLDELRAYAGRYFDEPVRYLATSRGAHAAALLRFALAGPDEQRLMLGLDEPSVDSQPTDLTGAVRDARRRDEVAAPTSDEARRQTRQTRQTRQEESDATPAPAWRPSVPDTIRDQRIRTAWPTAIRSIVSAYDPARVILFGSQARGDAQPDSDVDLLVVFDDDRDRRERRIGIRRLLRDMPFAKDVLVASTADLQHSAGSTAVAAALREGVVVYER